MFFYGGCGEMVVNRPTQTKNVNYKKNLKINTFITPLGIKQC